MTHSSYRAAKRWDARIQVIVLCLVILFGVVCSIPYFNDLLIFGAAGFYFGIGGVQFLSWLCWLIATPKATFQSGRGRYSIALLLVLAITGLAWLTNDEDTIFSVGFGALFVTPFMAIAYFVTTVNEAKIAAVNRLYRE